MLLFLENQWAAFVIHRGERVKARERFYIIPTAPAPVYIDIVVVV
jgi:hypothetical protein